MYSWLTHCCSLTYVYFVKSLVMLLLCCYFSLYHCIWLYENKDIYIYCLNSIFIIENLVFAFVFIHLTTNQNIVYIYIKRSDWTIMVYWGLNQSSERFFSVRTSASLTLRSTFHESKYFHTKIFPYIFHIKPLIFKTLSWSHSLSDFHEIFSIKHRKKN